VHESSIFKVWRGLVLYIFVIFGGLVSGWLREWILSDFGSILRVILAAKIYEKTLEIPLILEGFRGGPPESVHPPVEGNGRIQGGQPVSHIIDILDILEQEDSKAHRYPRHPRTGRLES